MKIKILLLSCALTALQADTIEFRVPEKSRLKGWAHKKPTYFCREDQAAIKLPTEFLRNGKAQVETEESLLGANIWILIGTEMQSAHKSTPIIIPRDAKPPHIYSLECPDQNDIECTKIELVRIEEKPKQNALQKIKSRIKK